MLKAKIFTLAALVVVLMSNVQTGRAEEPDPRILWIADSSIGIIHGFAVHPNGNVFAYRNNSIFEIDGKTGKVIKGYPIFTDSLKTQKINTLVFSDDGRYMAVEGIYLYDFQEEKISKININNTTFVLEFLPNSHKIANAIGGTQNKTHSILVYDIDNNQTIQSTVIEEMIDNIAFSPDGKYMATAGTKEKSDGNYYTVFKLWDAKTLKLLKELDKFDNAMYQISNLKFSQNGMLVGYKSGLGLNIYNTQNYSLFKHYHNEIVNDYLTTFEFLNDKRLLLQSKVTAFLSLEDDSVIPFFEIPWRSSIKLNKEISKIIICSFFKSNLGPICCLDLNYILSNVEEKKSPDFRVYYNNNTINIADLEVLTNNLQIEIFDITGNLIKQLDLPIEKSELNIPLKLPIGTYLINLSSGNKKFSSKFIVTK